MEKNQFDEDYYEQGPESGKSLYKNYRWMPELTIPMAMAIIDFLEIKKGQTVLDFGCAKGYLVRALRLLNRAAWGLDTSEYAINKADCIVKDYCFLAGNEGIRINRGLNGFPQKFDYCIAKDVFEHVPEDRLSFILRKEIFTNVLFAIIPLAENGVYRSNANEFDTTHIIKEDEKWWVKFFNSNGWQIKKFDFKIEGIKDSYYKTTPLAHGFFTAVRG